MEPCDERESLAAGHRGGPVHQGAVEDKQVTCHRADDNFVSLECGSSALEVVGEWYYRRVKAAMVTVMVEWHPEAGWPPRNLRGLVPELTSRPVRLAISRHRKASQVFFHERRDAALDLLHASAQAGSEVVGEEHPPIEVLGILSIVLRCQVLPFTELVRELSADVRRDKASKGFNAGEIALRDEGEAIKARAGNLRQTD